MDHTSMQVSTNNREMALVAAALRRMEVDQKAVAFDPINLNSRPTPKQQEVFKEFGRYKIQAIRAGNQTGKSATCARIVSWVLSGNHPYWSRPIEWGEEPLLILVAGRTGKQIEDSLLPKIRSFLEPGTYKEVRVGNMIQRLEMSNGDRVIFQSLENPTTAQERLQSYVAHMVWIDELPPTMGILRELLIRVQARNGYLLMSFTPTVINIEIQKYIDSLKEPEGKVYRFHMLDNPLYSDPVRKRELVERYAHLPEHVQKVIFEGDWSTSEDMVYYFNWDTMVEFPQGYSPLWRHVVSVDPALKSALGLTVWAENPQSNMWYCVTAEYVRGIYVPTDLVAHVESLINRINVVKRISDPHETWYITTAQRMGYNYVPIYKKNDRKSELIKKLQQFLGSRCKLSPEVHRLISELQECRWSDKSDGRIINSSSYHLLDSAQYFCDEIPKSEAKAPAYTQQQWLLIQNQKRLAMEEVAEKRKEMKQKMQFSKLRRRRQW